MCCKIDKQQLYIYIYIKILVLNFQTILNYSVFNEAQDYFLMMIC